MQPLARGVWLNEDAEGVAHEPCGGGKCAWTWAPKCSTRKHGLYRTILAFTGGRSDIAGDAVCQAFARAAARTGEVARSTAWLYRVAFNVAH